MSYMCSANINFLQGLQVAHVNTKPMGQHSNGYYMVIIKKIMGTRNPDSKYWMPRAFSF